MSRNVFENNHNDTVEVPLTDLTRLGDKLYTILPLLEDGSRYQLDTLSNGRVAVVIEKG